MPSPSPQDQRLERLANRLAAAAGRQEAIAAIAEAATWFDPGAPADARAMVDIGHRLIEGRGLAREPEAGRAWLERAASAGDGLAALALGQRLCEGLGLPPDPEAGVRWIARGAAMRFPPAMAAHGDRLLAAGDPAGAAWLEDAAGAGYAPAMTRLGLRLRDGEGIARDEAAGTRWLERAAEKGHGKAHGVLGAAMLEAAPEAGARHLWEALRRGELHYGLVLGMHHYQAGAFDRAAEVFAACLKMGASSAAVNVASMKRRGEWPAALEAPEAEALLLPLAEAGHPWAVVNLALLRQAHGAAGEAERLIAGLGPEAAAEVLPWWEALAAQGDPEGRLVLGWLGG
ncbi:MAG: tetratricopeptide repeat protein [Candidatus Sericytochromatia bacterium]